LLDAAQLCRVILITFLALINAHINTISNPLGQAQTSSKLRIDAPQSGKLSFFPPCKWLFHFRVNRETEDSAHVIK
jgi:hypothetical protein